MQPVAVSSKYQVVIPKRIRESAGINPGDKMFVVKLDGIIQLIPAIPISILRGSCKGMDTNIEREEDEY